MLNKWQLKFIPTVENETLVMFKNHSLKSLFKSLRYREESNVFILGWKDDSMDPRQEDVISKP